MKNTQSVHRSSLNSIQENEFSMSVSICSDITTEFCLENIPIKNCFEIAEQHKLLFIIMRISIASTLSSYTLSPI